MPTPVFSLTDDESRLANHLDALFQSNVNSTFSREFYDIWTVFRKRPCKDILFSRSNLLLQVLLPESHQLFVLGESVVIVLSEEYYPNLGSSEGTTPAPKRHSHRIQVAVPT
ncbi:hypothetical protein AVEN_84237-1 [Araneus ventricosus]|uniref:Uncharacterized protein n=1 Tax=Araneus ventricosus TaxID=182803 RepID=A0A4Y2L189_ARAVE|nr:hypothetical protein AVEN_84237-1 [Araneus ventricosus]